MSSSRARTAARPHGCILAARDRGVLYRWGERPPAPWGLAVGLRFPRGWAALRARARGKGLALGGPRRPNRGSHHHQSPLSTVLGYVGNLPNLQNSCCGAFIFQVGGSFVRPSWRCADTHCTASASTTAAPCFFRRCTRRPCLQQLFFEKKPVTVLSHCVVVADTHRAESTAPQPGPCSSCA